MNQKNEGDTGKRRRTLSVLALAGLGCLLSFALVFLISYLYLRNREREIGGEETSSAVVESGGAGASEGEGSGAVSAPESGSPASVSEPESSVPESSEIETAESGAEPESGTAEAETTEAETGSESQSEAETTEAETSGAGSEAESSEPETTEAETEPETSPYLPSVRGIAVGTVIPEDQIDFSQLDNYFLSWKIEEGDNLYERINGKSYRANPYVPLSTLRYLKLLHYNFEGNVQVGELIVNEDVVLDMFEIFQEMFRQKYQVESMYLVDEYWTGDPDSTDTASIEYNNTSAFNYRVVTGGGNLSKHAYGRAIDLNPQQNPYVSYSTGSPRWHHRNADAYIDRTTGLPHVITHSDLAYQLFTEKGFRWGGDWNNPKDYQHFDREQRSSEAEKLHALELSGSLPSGAVVTLLSTPVAQTVPQDEDFVRIRDYIPDISVDLRYATANNFTGKVIYDFDDPSLRYGTVRKLMKVQEQLRADGYSLKIWDAYRPVYAQWKLWEAYPDPAYVANPAKGTSPHCRGNTVDVTLVDAQGRAVEMPTDFDDFSSRADRDYSDVSEAARTHAAYLEEVMKRNGFNAYFAEWWHYSDTVSYPVEG